jgi:hypothetical protein
MDNKINDSQTERLETFETKLTLFRKYPNTNGRQEFCRTDFGSRLLAAEGEEGEGQCG